MSLLDTASLIVTPNGYKEGKLYSVIPSDGSGDLSVTRATTATRVNSAGLVELVPYNLFTYSSSFSNAAWGKINASVTGGQSGYDGTTNAFLLSDNSANGVHLIAQTPIVSGQHTISIYAKANSLNWVWLRGVQNSLNVRAWFNLSTGTIGNVETNGTANIESVGNGWYRCSLTIANHQSGFEFYYGVSNANNVESYIGSGQSIFVQDAQLVEGSTAKDYQKTETRLNIPRLDYSNGTCPSLLVEPQRTNLFTYSSSFDNAAWTKVSSTATANTTISPSGIQDADTIAFSSGGYVGQILTSSGAHSYSVYAKYIGTQWLYVQNYNGNDFGAWFDIQNGVVGTIESGVTASIEQAENGFYRCTITMTASSSSSSYWVFFNTTGNGSFTRTGSSYFWGAQLEAGSYATSYIPTTSASVTRNADVISKTGISSLIGQTEGTIFVDFYNYANNSTIQGTPLAISNSGFYGDAIYFEQYLGNWYAAIWNGTSQQFIANAGTLSEGVHRFALAYKANDIAFYVDGNQIATDNSATIPTCARIDLGAIGTSTTPEQMGINAAALWKTRLTNTQLAQLTTI
jgi:hypothetical protein